MAAYGVETCFKPPRTLRQMLVVPKDKSEKKGIAGKIYSIHCQGKTSWGQCEGFYIGETECSLKARFLEHRCPSSTSLEVSKHIHIESPGHHIDLINMDIKQQVVYKMSFKKTEILPIGRQPRKTFPAVPLEMKGSSKL